MCIYLVYEGNQYNNIGVIAFHKFNFFPFLAYRHSWWRRKKINIIKRKMNEKSLLPFYPSLVLTLLYAYKMKWIVKKLRMMNKKQQKKSLKQNVESLIIKGEKWSLFDCNQLCWASKCCFRAYFSVN